MTKFKLMFYLVVLEFISDFYSIYKINKKPEQMSQKFTVINNLKGEIMDKLEEE